MTGLLDDIRVLDFTQMVAGPVCTRMMAELGAEVIKVELAPNGDHSRTLPAFRDGRSAYFCQHNRGKQSLCLDIRKPEAAPLIRALIETSDVMVENFSPGAIARMGFGWEVVKSINPRLIMCSISAFGQAGPLRDLPGFDYVAQALSGVTSMVGDPDKPPALIGLAPGDVGTGITALSAINAALFRRERDGKGRYIDISLLDFYFHCHELNVQLASLGAWSPTRTGSQHGAVAPLGIFATRTGPIFLVVLAPMWLRLLEAMRRPDLATDPRFAAPADRVAHREILAGIVQAWLDTFENRDAALAALEAARVPVAPVLSVEEAMAHPHLIERRTVLDVEDPVIGRFQVPASPLRFPEEVQEEVGRAPFMGEHNAEILFRHAGIGERRLAELEKLGVILAEKRPG